MIKKSSLIFILFFFLLGTAECESLEPLAIRDFSLNAPDGQGQYVHNGNILTFNGSVAPHSTLVSARLVDNQDHMIRDVSKGLKINPNTGDISGSFFVGSFRGAALVHLNAIVLDPTGIDPVKCRSNTLSVDNTYPEIQIIRPTNHSYFTTAPIIIYGTTSDNLSGIASVKICADGGLPFCSVDYFRNGQWEYAYTPTSADSIVNIKVKSTDNVGLSTVSDNLSIHYQAKPKAPPPTVKKIVKTSKNNTDYSDYKNTYKSPDDDGICTYRVTNLKNSRFQPTDLFTIKEEMAIIVKGYGGNVVTIKIMVPSTGKVIFEMVDYIPENKQKIWRWEVSSTGIFQAALFVDGIKKDNVYFKIIQ